MLLLSCSDLSRAFDADPLFENLGFELYSGERVGLVGPNGVGKTTLLRILAGLDEPDTGEVRCHAGARLGLLEQHPNFTPGRSLLDEARTALDQFVAAHDEMIRIAEDLATTVESTERKALEARYDRLHEMLSHHDAFHVDHRIEQVLTGLGFESKDFGRPVESFSGGQQNRLMLAKILLASPDVMLLDEPNNHLDIDATRWLEEYLVKQPEAMLIVSHDRYFLDRVVTKIFELHRNRLTSYPGNYRAYVDLRQQRYEHELKAWEAQKEYIEKQEEYIRRVHYGQLHKQAQSRRKALERLERVEPPVLIEGPKMHFREVRRSGDMVLEAEGISKGYDRPLFESLSFTLKRGQRLGIMGPNGCGKTTLLRLLLKQDEPDRGQVKVGHLVEFGYYDQHLNLLPHDQPVLHAVWPDEDPELKEQPIRDLLARFGITGDQVHQRVGNLSGGEKSRVALARLVALGVNTLVLDEPTNHLDLWARDALEQALRQFPGTVIVVSHDRYFLNQVVDQLIVFENSGRVNVIFGNYETYERMRALQSDAEPTRKDDKPSRPKVDNAPPAPVKRKRRFPYRKVEDIESEIGAEEMRLQELERLLASPEIYRDADKVKETTRLFEDTRQRLHHLYEHWEEAVELN